LNRNWEDGGGRRGESVKKSVGVESCKVEAELRSKVYLKVGGNEGSSCSKATGHLPSETAVDSDSLADRHSCGPMISPDALKSGRNNDVETA